MLRGRGEVNELSVEVIADRLILVHRVDDDDVVVRREENLRDLLLGLHPLAGAGKPKDKAISIQQRLPVADQDVAAYLVHSICDASRLIQLMYDEWCKCCKRLCQQRVHCIAEPCAAGRCRMEGLDLFPINRFEMKPLSFCRRAECCHVVLQFLTRRSVDHHIDSHIEHPFIVVVDDVQEFFDLTLLSPDFIGNIAGPGACPVPGLLLFLDRTTNLHVEIIQPLADRVHRDRRRIDGNGTLIVSGQEPVHDLGIDSARQMR